VNSAADGAPMGVAHPDSMQAVRGGVGTPRATARTWVRRILARHWPIVLVLGLFAASAFVVPTLTPVATTDDWGYARSVQILVHDGRLEIFSVVAATAVFQIVWGALFGLIFGPTLGVFRLSTVVMVGLGAWALYGLCRELGVDRGRSALGVASYAFNPLTFVLAFTFMTDPHFTSLLLMATYFYVRGEGEGPGAIRATVTGSIFAALAFLTRQQGVLIPMAVVSFLLFSGGWRPTFRNAWRFLAVVTLPVLSTLGYYLWLRIANSVPDVQSSFLRQATATGIGGTWELVQRLTIVELMYLGFFTLPIVAAAIPAFRRLLGGTPLAGRIVFFAWEAVLIAGVVATWKAGGRMPYIGQFFGTGGPGAPDVLGSRARIFDTAFRDRATIVCAIASLALALVLCRRVGARGTPGSSKAGLVLAIVLWQVVGVLPPSFHYIHRGGSLDRYLLPLLPLSLALALWALRDVEIARPLGWLVVAAFAVVAVAGTRDYLVYMTAVWRMAEEANAAGVTNQHLDAGSGWDGYHLYEYSRDNKIRSRTPKGGPWWVYFYAPATDSSYVVSGKPLPGYVEVFERDYSSWLNQVPTRLYLLRRPSAPWPPQKAPSTRAVIPDAGGAPPWLWLPNGGSFLWSSGSRAEGTVTSS